MNAILIKLTVVLKILIQITLRVPPEAETACSNLTNVELQTL